MEKKTPFEVDDLDDGAMSLQHHFRRTLCFRYTPPCSRVSGRRPLLDGAIAPLDTPLPRPTRCFFASHLPLRRVAPQVSSG